MYNEFPLFLYSKLFFKDISAVSLTKESRISLEEIKYFQISEMPYIKFDLIKFGDQNLVFA